MKTTVELPESLYRQIKARAALQGQTIKRFFLDALQEKLAADRSKPDAEKGWRAAFGAAENAEIAEVQQIIDDEFSKIDPSDWK